MPIPKVDNNYKDDETFKKVTKFERKQNRYRPQKLNHLRI